MLSVGRKKRKETPEQFHVSVGLNDELLQAVRQDIFNLEYTPMDPLKLVEKSWHYKKSSGCELADMILVFN